MTVTISLLQPHNIMFYIRINLPLQHKECRKNVETRNMEHGNYKDVVVFIFFIITDKFSTNIILTP